MTTRFRTSRSGPSTITTVVRAWVSVWPPSVTVAWSMKPVGAVSGSGVVHSRTSETSRVFLPQNIVYLASALPSHFRLAFSPLATKILVG